MPDSAPQIINPAALAKLKANADNPATGRQRTAFNRGGEFDLVTFADGTVVAVVPDPAKLTKEQSGEVTKAYALLLTRRAALAAEKPPRRRAPAPSAK